MVPPSLAKSPLLYCSLFMELPSEAYLSAVHTNHCLSYLPIYPSFSGCSYKIIFALHHKSKQTFLSSYLRRFFISTQFSAKKAAPNSCLRVLYTKASNKGKKIIDQEERICVTVDLAAAIVGGLSSCFCAAVAAAMVTILVLTTACGRSFCCSAAATTVLRKTLPVAAAAKQSACLR